MLTHDLLCCDHASFETVCTFVLDNVDDNLPIYYTVV